MGFFCKHGLPVGAWRLLSRRLPKPSRPAASCRGWLLLALLTLALPWAAGPALARDWPRPAGHLGDYAQVVETEYQPQIATAAREIERQTGASLLVATLPSLEGQTLEQTGAGLYQAWGMGPKGALILVAVDQRRMHIHLGQALAANLDNTQAGQVRDKVMVPHLRQGRYGQGLHEGVLALGQALAAQTGVELEGLPRVDVPAGGRAQRASWYLWGAAALLLLVYALAKTRRLLKDRKA